MISVPTVTRSTSNFKLYAHSGRPPVNALAGGVLHAKVMQIQARLSRVVGPDGAVALLLRAQYLCGPETAGSTVFVRTLHQLVGHLLGESLAECLLDCDANAKHVPVPPSRLP